MNNLKDYIGKEITLYRIIDDLKNTYDYTIQIIDKYIIKEKDIRIKGDDYLRIYAKWRYPVYLSLNEYEFIGNVAWSVETDIYKIKSVIDIKRNDQINELKENISKMKQRIKRLENPKYLRTVELD